MMGKRIGLLARMLKHSPHQIGHTVVHNVSNAGFDDINRIGIETDFQVRNAVAIVIRAYNRQSYGGESAYGQARILRDSARAIVPYDAMTGHGCWIEYASAGHTCLTLDIFYYVSEL